MDEVKPGQVRRALARAERGAALDLAEATALLAARGEELDRLCAAAARVRDAGLVAAGRRRWSCTYSPKVFIPVTRLCRDRCHYCTFVETPGHAAREGRAPYLSPDEILDIARQGGELGCLEALFTLGDRPEDRWPEAREWLDEQGYDSTLAYVRAMAVRVLEETGLLPHLNPGVMSWEELNRLKPVSPSMGMMLETTSTRLFTEKGEAHYGSPDKDPAVRLRVLEDAGRLSIPFTTGLLVGIGENLTERAETIFAIRAVARQYAGIQEVIVQNFRAKPDTAMRHADDLGLDEYRATIAVTRLLLGPKLRVQAPPNLVDLAECRALLEAGVDDWGGVSPLTPDHVNPERPWPSPGAAALDHRRVRLRARGPGSRSTPSTSPTASRGSTPGSPATSPRWPSTTAWRAPAYARWACRGRSRTAVSPASGGHRPHRPARRHRHHRPHRGPPQRLRRGLRRLGRPLREQIVRRRNARPTGRRRRRSRRTIGAGAGGAGPGGLTDEQALALITAEGERWSRCAGWPTTCAGRPSATTSPTSSTATSTSPTSATSAAGSARSPSGAPTPTRSRCPSTRSPTAPQEAWELGATEVCMQGGIDPELPGTAYFDLAAAVKRRVPGMHVHAFSPMEIVNGASRTGLSVEDFLIKARESGLDTIPGTAAEILDDEVRWVLTKGKLPAPDLDRRRHHRAPRGPAVQLDDDVRPRRQPAALGRSTCACSAGSRTRPAASPSSCRCRSSTTPRRSTSPASPGPGPTLRDNLAVHAVARILLHGRIDNIQTSWVKLGTDGTRAMLRAGANDLGGTLMEETISRMAGSEHGSAKTVAELTEIAAGVGRPVRERTTTYGVPREQ